MKRIVEKLRSITLCALATACGAAVPLDDADAGTSLQTGGGGGDQAGGSSSGAPAGGSESVSDDPGVLVANGRAPSSMHPVIWKTETVTLLADDFFISVDGQYFYTVSESLQVHSDPGYASYTTLELVWNELGREMRLFIYFNANSERWWSKEIRTYDGAVGADWIFYYGDFFEQPLGTPYQGDLVLTNNGPSDTAHGTLSFHNLWLLPTFRQ